VRPSVGVAADAREIAVLTPKRNFCAGGTDCDRHLCTKFFFCAGPQERKKYLLPPPDAFFKSLI
jgi:hypothetical protein